MTDRIAELERRIITKNTGLLTDRIAELERRRQEILPCAGGCKEMSWQHIVIDAIALLKEQQLSVESRGAAVTEFSKENARLRAAIEQAPHGISCSHGWVSEDGNKGKCNCWKRKVLGEKG